MITSYAVYTCVYRCIITTRTVSTSTSVDRCTLRPKTWHVSRSSCHCSAKTKWYVRDVYWLTLRPVTTSQLSDTIHSPPHTQTRRNTTIVVLKPCCACLPPALRSVYIPKVYFPRQFCPLHFQEQFTLMEYLVVPYRYLTGIPYRYRYWNYICTVHYRRPTSRKLHVWLSKCNTVIIIINNNNAGTMFMVLSSWPIATARVHPVHLTNVGQRRASTWI